MAEDYGVTLKITADTSDLDKIPQKVDEAQKKIEKPVAQPEPVKINVEQPEPVKVPVEQPKPVKVEAKAEKVRVEVEDAEAKKRIEALTEKEGVKRIRVVTEGGELATRQGGKEIFELEVDAEKAKQTIAALKSDARIKVTADTSAAERSTTSFFASFRRGVTALRASISTVFAAFGMVSFVVGGIMALVAGFQKLRDMVTATSRSIAQMRWDSWVGGFNSAADALIGKHQKIIALLREEQDIANKAASLRTMETSQNRSQEDSARQQVRNAALSGTTDPRERQRLEDKFEEEDEKVSRRRFEEDRRNRLRQLDEEESIYRSKEKGARAQLPKIDEEISNQENVIDIARRSIARGGDKEKNEKYIEEAKKRIASLKDEKKQTEALIETMKREADYRVEQSKIVEQSKAPTGNQIVREARKRALEEDDRREQSDFKRGRDKSAAAADFDERFRDAQRLASAPDATESQRKEAENTQLQMLQDKEDRAKADLEDAEKILAEELKKDAKDRNERRMNRARADITSAEAAAAQASQQREDLFAQIENRRVAQAQDYFGNLAQQIDASRPKNRLTAMGLGSGGPSDTGKEQVSLMKEIIKEFHTAIAAIRANRPGDGTAVYAP